MIKFVLPTRGCVYLWLYPQCPLILVWSENKLCLWLQTRNFNCLIKKFCLWSAIKEVKTSWNKCNIFLGSEPFLCHPVLVYHESEVDLNAQKSSFQLCVKAIQDNCWHIHDVQHLHLAIRIEKRGRSNRSIKSPKMSVLYEIRALSEHFLKSLKCFYGRAVV